MLSCNHVRGIITGRASVAFTAIAQNYIADGPAERADRARRKLLGAIGEREPATLKQVAAAVRRGAPAVSRSIESLVKAGLVDRAPDPDQPPPAGDAAERSWAARARLSPQHRQRVEKKLGRLAQSELRAIERAVEILER